MLFDAVPPDTSIYMIAGYSIFFIVGAIYLVSLFVRERNLRRDLETLESLEREAKSSAPASAPSTKRTSQAKRPRAKQAQKKATQKR